nr:hypothetical protein [Tanacetum cinerariifolium]
MSLSLAENVIVAGADNCPHMLDKTQYSSWTSRMLLCIKALELRVILDEEQMAFLEDNRDTIITFQASQDIPTPAAFQTDDLDAFDSDCYEAPSASAILMAKFSLYDS